ncbi:MAG TPA: DoxX family protein [Usitatibacter sp.]|nr:DoxX family protein [Usitatibacter sp.]
MNPNVQNTAALVGRILLAAIFLTSGLSKITGFDGTVGYIASKHLPLPQVGAIIATLCELGGGILLLVGFKARWAGLVLAIFTLAAGLLFHDYWNLTDAAQVAANKINFWKNVAISGGMLMVFAFGPGRYSVDKA